MNDSAILNIGARADANLIDIATKHAAEPDRTARADFDVADHDCARRNKGRRVNFRHDAAIREEDGRHEEPEAGGHRSGNINGNSGINT